MSVHSKMLFKTISEIFNEIVPAYFEDADAPNVLPYCVINNPVRTSISDQDGELIAFYVDIFGDDREENSEIELIDICDSLRNRLDKAIISSDGLGGHLNFEKDLPIQESDFDINHRRQEWTARVFYY